MSARDAPPRLDGVDLSGYVTDTLGVDIEPWQHRVLEQLHTRTITISGYWERRTSSRPYWEAYQAWRARRRVRLARMRTAYHRRRR